MYNKPSRMEIFWEKSLKTAKNGKWSIQLNLYSSEIRRIEKQWDVKVTTLKEYQTQQEMIPCIVTWNNAFREGINCHQSWYISQILDEMPEVATLAQKLFLISARN